MELSGTLLTRLSPAGEWREHEARRLVAAPAIRVRIRRDLALTIGGLV